MITGFPGEAVAAGFGGACLGTGVLANGDAPVAGPEVLCRKYYSMNIHCWDRVEEAQRAGEKLQANT